MWLNNATQYGVLSKTLHWLVVVAVLIMIPFGFLVGESPSITLIHKDLGLIVLILMIFRVLLIFLNHPPCLPLSIKRYERYLSHLVQYGLYVVLLLMPLTGWFFTSAGGRPPTFWGWAVSMPFVAPGVLASIAWRVHLIGVWVLIGLITLHVAGALKHHVLDRRRFIDRIL